MQAGNSNSARLPCTITSFQPALLTQLISNTTATRTIIIYARFTNPALYYCTFNVCACIFHVSAFHSYHIAVCIFEGEVFMESRISYFQG